MAPKRNRDYKGASKKGKSKRRRTGSIPVIVPTGTNTQPARKGTYVPGGTKRNLTPQEVAQLESQEQSMGVLDIQDADSFAAAGDSTDSDEMETRESAMDSELDELELNLGADSDISHAQVMEVLTGRTSEAQSIPSSAHQEDANRRMTRSMVKKTSVVPESDEPHDIQSYLHETMMITIPSQKLSCRVWYKGYADDVASHDAVIFAGEKFSPSDGMLASLTYVMAKSPKDWAVYVIFFLLNPPPDTEIPKAYLVLLTIGQWLCLDQNNRLYHVRVKKRSAKLVQFVSELIDGPYDLERDFDGTTMTFKGIKILEICGIDVKTSVRMENLSFSCSNIQ
jgi:hypothetical protein